MGEVDLFLFLFKYVDFGKMMEPKVSGVTWLLYSLSASHSALDLDLAKMLFLAWPLTETI